jgi:hypothetical protein
MAWGAAAAGLLGYLSAQEGAKANVEAGREATRRQREREERVTATGNITGSPLGSQSFGPEGFKLDYGPSGAAATRSLGTRQATDEASATRVKDALGNFKLDIPNLRSARGIIAEENLRRREPINQTIAAQAMLNQRNLGRERNTEQGGALIDAMARFESGLGGTREAIDLRQRSEEGNLKNLRETIAAYQPQGVSAEDYPGPSLGGTGALAQIPITQPTPDISGALVPAGAGNVLQQVLNAREVERLEGRSDVARRELLAAIRQNPNQFNVPGGVQIDWDVGGAGGAFLPKPIA